MRRWIRNWLDDRYKQKRCFHHEMGGNPANTLTAFSWIKQQIIDHGRKMYWCDRQLGGCGKTWII